MTNIIFSIILYRYSNSMLRAQKNKIFTQFNNGLYLLYYNKKKCFIIVLFNQLSYL